MSSQTELKCVKKHTMLMPKLRQAEVVMNMVINIKIIMIIITIIIIPISITLFLVDFHITNTIKLKKPVDLNYGFS